jgi:multiple sugar transport system permease protein
MSTTQVGMAATSSEARRLAGEAAARRRRAAILRGVYLVVALAGAVLMFFPVFWLVSTALKPSNEVFTSPPILFPGHPQWHNVPDALTSSALPDGNFFVYIWNTTWYTALEVLGDTFVGAFVAFGFARLRAPGSTVLFFLVLATIMVPFQATLIPQIVLFRTLGWFDTPLPLIVPTFFGNAFNIFLLRQFFRGIPRELDEAATIDGLGYPGIFFRIILPLSKPALAAVAVFSFVFHWNDLLQPLIYLNSTRKYPVSVALQSFTGAYGLAEWNLLMAAALIAALPCLILFFVAQRYFIQGIVVSGVKG